MKLYLIIIALSLFLLASNSFAVEYEFSGNFGGFLFTSTFDSDFTGPWAEGGYLVGGQFALWINPKNAICFNIEDIRTSKESRFEGTWTKANSDVLFFLLLFKKRGTVEGSISPYISGGFGFSSMGATITIEEGIFEANWTDFAYKACVGLEISRFLSLEAGYMSGRRNGNTGLVLSIRVGGYIGK
jgi:hypothetical protein